MRISTRHLGIVASLVGAVALSASAPFAPINLQPESRLWVDGTSTVRDYTCKSGPMQATVTANANSSLTIGELDSAVRSVDLSIPVQGLDCANGTMNGHLRNALKAKEFPTVRFQLAQYDIVPTGGGNGTAKLVGKLQIAGQERPISIDATVAVDGNGTLRVKGSREILMSEYGVKAPTLMMGTLKVRDKVVVNFDVVLKQS